MEEFNWELFNSFVEMEVECFSSFTTVTKTSWGYFLHNADWKERHDANHALVTTTDEDHGEIIEGIKQFYQDRELTPRINFYHPDYDHSFKSSLRSRGFVTSTYRGNISKPVNFYHYSRKGNPPPVQISHPENSSLINGSSVNSDNWFAKDLEKILLPEEDFNRVINHPDYHYFLLYAGEEPVSMLSLFFNSKYRSTRLDDVITRAEHRRKGYSTFLVNHALSMAYKKKYSTHLYVLEDNAERIYRNVGFKIFASCKDNSWYMTD